MPPRASTSKLAHDTPSQSRSASSSSVSVKSRRGGGGNIGQADSDMSMMMMQMMEQEHDGGGAAGSSDDELLDEDEEEQRQLVGSSSRLKGGASSSSSSKARSSKGRSSTAASVAGGEDHEAADTPGDSTTTKTTAGMSKEEAALADRRRRNRETQRAIRKKKANRLQDAEVKVSLYESELEKLKVKLREMELENTNLKREIEDWRMGRIHANPSIVAATAQQQLHPHPSQSHRQHHHRGPPPVSASAAATPEDRHRLSSYSSSIARAYPQPASVQYQPYDIPSEERKILGKRRQSFDAVHRDPRALQSTSPPTLSAGQTSFGRSFPSPSSQVEPLKSPSVLQPIPTIPLGHLTSDMEYSAHTRHSPDHSSLPPQVDTCSNGDGSYGGSDPSPSSAGTVVPSYTSTFTAHPEDVELIPSSTMISEAVRAVRTQEAIAKEGATVAHSDNIPRSHSIMSTVSNSISDSSLSSTNKRSYDDYHDIWTSVSTGTNSQSQSDSLTSMSSYSRNASSSVLAGPTASSGKNAVSSVHLTTPGGSTVADGMILSMSRQSLCASPVSIAEEHDEPMQAVQPNQGAPGQVKVKPSLPSLSATLNKGQYASGPRSPERTSSLPLPASSTAVSPPVSSLPPMHSHSQYQQHHHHQQYQPPRHPTYPTSSTSPGAHTRTLPPISSIYQNRQDTLPLFPAEYGPYRSSPVTRNGRGKTTSYPALPGADTASQEQSSFNWPTTATSTSRPRPIQSSSFGGPILPLPRRAGARPPMSSTRDDSPSSYGQNSVKEQAMSMSPSQLDDSAVMDAEGMDGDSKGQHHNGDARHPQRRKSTYEDFVEVFGA